MRIICIYASAQTWSLRSVLWICLKANITIQRQADRGFTSTSNPHPTAVSLVIVNHCPHEMNQGAHETDLSNLGERLQPFCHKSPCIVAVKLWKWKNRNRKTEKKEENKFRRGASFAPVHPTFKPSVPPWLQYSWLVYSILPNQHNKVCDEADKI